MWIFQGSCKAHWYWQAGQEQMRMQCGTAAGAQLAWGLQGTMHVCAGAHRKTFTAACRRLVYACADTPEDAMACRGSA